MNPSAQNNKGLWTNNPHYDYGTFFGSYDAFEERLFSRWILSSRFRPNYGQTGSNPLAPAKSHFDQVHVASRASEPNLAKTPFFVHFDATFGSSVVGLFSELTTTQPETRQIVLIDF